MNRLKEYLLEENKVTRDPPYPEGSRRPSHSVQVDKEAGEKEGEVPSPRVDTQEPELMKDFYDTILLPFPQM
jgi:hypothetical protein